jgi:hypothetical protein
MKVKITVEVANESVGLQVSMIEVDRMMRGCLNGMLEKYRGRIDNIQDHYSGDMMYGSIVKSKMCILADEEVKKEA